MTARIEDRHTRVRNRTHRLGRLAAALMLLFVAGHCWAQWELDSGKSSVRFISIKNNAVAESHSFGSLTGYIGSDGAVQLSIALDSVETLIEIRNQRMREILFETVEFPVASVTASIDPAIIAAAAGGTVITELGFTISLHGVEKSLSVPLLVVAEDGEEIQVFTPSPVIINAADFGLAAGVAALQSVAGLNAISAAVPVMVHLVFTRAK